MRQRGIIVALLVSASALAFLLVRPRIEHPSLRLERRGPLLTAPVIPRDRPRAETPPVSEPVGVCPRAMRLVAEWSCPFVAHRCLEKVGQSCARFDNRVLCEGNLKPMRFCIDVDEYPNLADVKPVRQVTFDEAVNACEIEDKRLCAVREWQLACEGPKIAPLPSALSLRDSGCVFSLRHDGSTFSPRPSGSGRCESAFGVRDLVGNVGEWVVDENGSSKAFPFRSSIAGIDPRGGPSCRTIDQDHPPAHRSPGLGFRCCTDPSDAVAPPSTPRKGRGVFAPIE